MGKTQPKINFCEKKKTSARLQESFAKKKDLNSKRNICEKLSSTISLVDSFANKGTKPDEYGPSASLTCDAKYYDKENKIKMGLPNKKNVAVSLCQSPFKNVEERRENEEMHLSPLKRTACPSEKNECHEDFTKAWEVLHSSLPTKLPGREDKLDFIKKYLLRHFGEQTSGALYISGPPGTGKTACVNVAITDHEICKAFKGIFLNCTTMNSCGSIYSRIASEMKLKVYGRSENSALIAIEKYFESNKRKMIILVLDELDQLCTNNQSVLYSMFEWPARADSRIILIGIANALDLTDRVLPRLQARICLKPTIVHFPSYTRQQIINIITDRLQMAGLEDMFPIATLQLLAAKVAAVNGDVRRALDIARRVVEMAEKKRTVLQTLSSNGSLKQTVTLQEVLEFVNDVYNTTQTLDSSQTNSFPLQQKLFVCSLLLIRQTSKAKDVTVGKLYEVYKKVCERRNMSALDISEFISLTSLVEARGVVRLIGKKYNRMSKVTLQWDESEVKHALQDNQLLSAVLMDKSVVT